MRFIERTWDVLVALHRLLALSAKRDIDSWRS